MGKAALAYLMDLHLLACPAVIVYGGDSHNAWSGAVRTEGLGSDMQRQLGGPTHTAGGAAIAAEGSVVGIEYAGTSITSPGLENDLDYVSAPVRRLPWSVSDHTTKVWSRSI